MNFYLLSLLFCPYREIIHIRRSSGLYSNCKLVI